MHHLGDLRLDRLLGRGATSEVWRAWHPDRQAPVAVKRAVGSGARPGPGPDLRAEAERLARVRHPGVVALLDVVDDPPGVALVLAHLGGGSLRELLAERGTLSAGELVAVLGPVADACSALGRHGLVHGDLKPEHLCFTEAGAPVLVDLGSAAALDRPHGAGRSGTPAYLDPAVAAGGAVAPSSDVFALAVVAYEALTGRLPHRGEPAHVLAAAAAGSHRSLRSWPGVAAAVAEVVEGALHPDPAARPTDPAALVAALRAVVARHDVVLPGPARQPEVPVRPRADRATTTLRFGPPPPAVAHRSRPAVGVRTVAGGAGLVASLALLAAGVAVARRAPAPVGARRPRAAPAAHCPSVLPPPPPGAVRRGDVDGDGCPDAARWDGATLVVAGTHGTRAFRIAAPGSQLVLGDWDGDGADAPGLYDPDTGLVRLVDRLPDAVGHGLGQSREVALAPGGRAVVVRSAAGPGTPDQVRVRGR